MKYQIHTYNDEEVHINGLSRSFCEKHCDEILKIINIIPYIDWCYDDLMRQNDYFKNKWNYSLVVLNSKNEIIGILIAYFRMADDKHIMDSLYVHKLAIRQDYQNLGIGAKLLSYFICKSFEEILWLHNITIQTNDNVQNRYVVDFYTKLGFIPLYNIEYGEKIDILMIYERSQYGHLKKNLEGYIDIVPKKLNHPRLNIIIDMFSIAPTVPIVYFSSTNSYKKDLIKFIFNNYNIEVSFVNPPVELIEPQIENPIIEEEMNLVRFPLKFASRFFNQVPYIIEDTMLFIEFFNRNNREWELPGHDTKRWWKQLGNEGVLDIMGNTKNRKAKFVSQTGAYLKSNEYYFGRGESTGYISEEIKTSDIHTLGTYPKFFHSIFIPDGANKTLAEMNVAEFAQYDYIRKSVVELIENLKYSYQFYEEYTLFTKL